MGEKLGGEMRHITEKSGRKKKIALEMLKSEGNFTLKMGKNDSSQRGGPQYGGDRGKGNRDVYLSNLYGKKKGPIG